MTFDMPQSQNICEDFTNKNCDFKRATSDRWRIEWPIAWIRLIAIAVESARTKLAGEAMGDFGDINWSYIGHLKLSH